MIIIRVRTCFTLLNVLDKIHLASFVRFQRGSRVGRRVFLGETLDRGVPCYTRTCFDIVMIRFARTKYYYTITHRAYNNCVPECYCLHNNSAVICPAISQCLFGYGTRYVNFSG